MHTDNGFGEAFQFETLPQNKMCYQWLHALVTICWQSTSMFHFFFTALDGTNMASNNWSSLNNLCAVIWDWPCIYSAFKLIVKQLTRPSHRGAWCIILTFCILPNMCICFWPSKIRILLENSATNEFHSFIENRSYFLVSKLIGNNLVHIVSTGFDARFDRESLPTK